jgi:hypothetical protein
MSDALAIARVVRSVVDTLGKREWSVIQSRSDRSLSRYIYAAKGKKRLKIRVSDHRPSKTTVCDLSYLPRNYRQRRLARYLDGRRKKPRMRLGRKKPR